MNILIDLLPESVKIDGVEYKINTNFRESMLFELLMQNEELSDKDKIYQALELYYPVLPSDIDKAIEKIIWFYGCGKDKVSSKSKGKVNRTNSVYDFEYDDDYIYAAFLDQYNIDLQDIEYLHWWKFKAMFKSLKEDNEIVKIMGYRSMDLSKIKDKDQRSYYKRMQELYKIPVSKNEQEKLDAINNALLGDGDLESVL